MFVESLKKAVEKLVNDRIVNEVVDEYKNFKIEIYFEGKDWKKTFLHYGRGELLKQVKPK